MSATVVLPTPSPSSSHSPSVSPSPTLPLASNEGMVEGGTINGVDAAYRALATAEQGIHLLLNIRCVQCGDTYMYSVYIIDGDWNELQLLSAAVHSVNFFTCSYFTVCFN